VEETRWRDILLTAVAPVAWGSTYIVTEKFLPPDRPLFSALVRALPIGLVLLALLRELPPRRWWGRVLVLGMCNIGLFYPLIFLSAYGLPGGLAATIQAINPLVVIALAWPMVGERATWFRLVGAVVGLAGVGLLVLQTPDGVTTLGLAGAFGSVLISAFGFLLVKRWAPPTDMLTMVSWQLVVGGLFLLPVAFLVEGPPPPVGVAALGGYLWIAVVGTGLAQWCWFIGLTRMPAGSVSIIGLVNPAVGTALGVAFAGELFGPFQAMGVLLVLIGVLAGQGRLRPRRRAAAPAPDPEVTPAGR
jgi:probable blue pigment (indigoidine) exporter